VADVYIQGPPVNLGFGFTFIKAAGGKMKTRNQNGLCAQQRAVLWAEDSWGSRRVVRPPGRLSVTSIAVKKYSHRKWANFLVPVSNRPFRLALSSVN